MSEETRELSREDVVAFYEVLLGREPESEDVIHSYLALESSCRGGALDWSVG